MAELWGIDLVQISAAIFRSRTGQTEETPIVTGIRITAVGNIRILIGVYYAVNIGGMYLTDNLSVPTRWRIPANNTAATTIPAGGYLLIWAACT